MAVYEFPGLGTLTVSRNGEVHLTEGPGLRYRWNVRGTSFSRDDSGPVVDVRTWITTPDYWDENCVVDAALVAVDYAVGDDTGTMWGVYASDIVRFDEPDTAAMYRVNGVSHYRETPYSYDSEGDTYTSIKDAVQMFKHRHNMGLVSVESVMDLFPNDSDEPTHRLIMGPRGGVSVERF